MPTNIKKESIFFPNGHEAIILFPSVNDKIDSIVSELQIKPYQAVLLVIGGADNIDDKLIPKLTRLFSQGIARAAIKANAVIIDGGTQAGIMSLMGKGVADRDNRSTLIGVAPVGMITYPNGPQNGAPLEPNHSHFILVEGKEWGSETATMFSLLSSIMGRSFEAPQTDVIKPKKDPQKVNNKVQGIAILTGGGSISRDEVLRAVRQDLSVIVIKESGGLADEIATAWENKTDLPEEPDLAEIIADGNLLIYSLSDSVKGLERLIIHELGANKVLVQAWETFADYDLNANLQQKRFDRLQRSILMIGLIGTGLAVTKQYFTHDIEFKDLSFPWKVVYHLLILIPILLTVLITASNRFKQGNKWLLLRAGAEAIKREIYRYRTRSGDYKKDCEQQLAQRVEDITRRTMRTEVNTTSLFPYNKDKGFPPDMYAAQGGDDGLSFLSADRYVEVRLGDQLNYFKKRSVLIEKQLKGLSWATFIVGGVGTYLAAINLQVWIAVTTAVVAALGTYLGYRQTENTLTKYNQAATNLSSVRAWWNALSVNEQSYQNNIDTLVKHTEDVLQGELDGWIQQMQNALAEMRKDQGGDKPEREENKEPKENTLNKDHRDVDGVDVEKPSEASRKNNFSPGRTPKSNQENVVIVPEVVKT